MTKHIASFVAAIIVALCVSTIVEANDCVKVNQARLRARLAEAQFPIALLSKVGVRDLAVFGDFTECSPRWFAHATMYVYAQRIFPYPQLSEDLSFMVLQFPSAAARDKSLKNLGRAEAAALKNKDDSVYYYLEPGSRKAFRVELWRGIPID